MTSRSFTDQLGDFITLSRVPQRIISLVPSQTELLYDLGLDKEVVGITKFCVHPPHWGREKSIVGGTKNFHFDTIRSLMPDLIIGNKEENYKEGIEQLRLEYPVWMSDIVSLDDAMAMISAVGTLTNKTEQAGNIVAKISAAFTEISIRPPKRVLYLIWRKPWMAAGAQTFIDTMLVRLGLVNCLAASPRYPQLTNDDIIALDADLVFLSSEPYPFNEAHGREIQRLLPAARIVMVDGEMFSWYGSRLMHAPAYFNSLELGAGD
jgi:ABC-type Fe3+-hydroxamate transport system substrate-binding protein